jgi:tetratricopeptide (TPR) repeat protein
VRFAAIVLLLALPSLADAAGDARAHLEAGRAHHKLGRFREALAEYERAYELEPVPDLLFNMGQCHRNLKNLERAIFFFERYLHEAPKSSDAPLVKKLVAELKAELPEQRAVEEVPVETATVAEAPPPPPMPTLALPPPEPEPVPEPEPESESDGVATKWWFWTLLVVGAAAVGGGVYAVTRASAPPDGSIGQIDLR